MQLRQFEFITLFLSLTALLISASKADYLVIGLGLLAFLVSVGFHKIIHKPDKVSAILNGLSLVVGLILSVSPLVAAILFYYSGSVQGGQTVFIVACYVIGMNLAVLNASKT